MMSLLALDKEEEERRGTRLHTPLHVQATYYRHAPPFVTRNTPVPRKASNLGVFGDLLSCEAICNGDMYVVLDL